jgi:hypothetical protein
MSTPPNDAQPSFTSQGIDAWWLIAQERCAALHIQAATSSNSLEYHEAFAGISALLQQALEKVHLLNTHIRKMRHTAGDRATAVQRHVTPLTEASRQWCERRDGSPPSPEEIQQAESRLLEMFRDGDRQDRDCQSKGYGIRAAHMQAHRREDSPGLCWPQDSAGLLLATSANKPYDAAFYEGMRGNARLLDTAASAQ